ncbi:MAG: hypothetical protein WC346_04530 [Methanogenium sp.]|jgi:hypothetical protein
MEGNIEEQEQFEEEYDENSQYQENEQQGDWDFGGSEPAPLGGIYGLFQKTLDRKDSLKVSNLKKEELGTWNMTVRDCKRVALIADTFHHPGVRNFFESQSRIITDSAMSRDGWFTELFVTSKRYASRDSSSSVKSASSPSTKKSKWKIFSNNQETPN